ncbi:MULTISPECIES: hypothetical protein [Streptomyces]|uniref:hypothetical protein n=1 Tax=Streptomyces TaxID=1883 RepID=UPI0012FF1ED5|nr:hypothetical protein [Streptomyces griseolus]
MIPQIRRACSGGRTWVALRVPVVLITLIAGAVGTASCGQGSPGVASPPTPRTVAARPEPSATQTLPQASDLPKHAVTSDKQATLSPGRTMATGYTGNDFLTGLAKDWKVRLEKPVEQEMPDGKMRTYVHGRGKNGMTVSAGYADHKNMSSLLCAAGTKEPGDFEFLASCTGLDVAGIDHAKASSWLDRAKKETDSLYEKQVAKTGIEQEYVVSGVLVSGPVRMVLHRTYGRYSLRILGGAAV